MGFQTTHLFIGHSDFTPILFPELGTYLIYAKKQPVSRLPKSEQNPLVKGCFIARCDFFEQNPLLNP
jgi:hypothetical protein